MPIDPCREWLGIDAVDLASPHLVLAVRMDETDPQAIERAAAARLRTLESINPGPFERAHAALVSRIGEARDEMLAAARRAAAQTRPEPPRGGLAPPPPPLSSGGVPSWPGAFPTLQPTTPPAPPPLPPPDVPTATHASSSPPAVPDDLPPPGDDAAHPSFSPVAGDAKASVTVGGRRRRLRRSGDAGWIVATIASLVAVAAALVAFVVISGQERGRRVAARGSERQRMPREEPAAPARRPDTVRRPAPVAEQPREEPAADEPIASAASREPMTTRRSPEGAERGSTPQEPDEPLQEPQAKDATPQPQPRDAPASPPAQEPAPEPTEEPAPTEPVPEDSAPTAAADPAAVERALKKAYGEIRAGRFAAAEKAIDEAGAAAPDDLTAGRVERWRLLVTYARQLAEYRDTALSEAAKGGDYNVDGSVISVVEMNATQFVYKDRGAMKRPPKDAIPPRIVLAILRTWFAGDGRPANDIYLGVQHIVGGETDLDGARAAWRRAGQGGEDVAPLVGLLADPVLRGGP